MSDYKAHVFICTQTKEKGDFCAAKGAVDLRARLKALSKKDKPHWEELVRVNSAGCLGKCSEGIACVIYPKGEWMTSLNGSDDQKIIDKIESYLK